MDWYAIRVEPGRERRLASRLRTWAISLGAMQIYLPICDKPAYLDLHRTEIDELTGKETKVSTGETQHVRSTIVPGYVFLRSAMNDDIAAAIVGMTGVLRLLPNSARPMPIDWAAIEGMRRECEKLVRQTGDAPDLDWMLGKTFRVEQGPMAGRGGICLSFSAKGEPQITLEVFKARYQSVPIPVEHLDLVPMSDQYLQDMVADHAKVRYKRRIRTLKGAALASSR